MVRKENSRRGKSLSRWTDFMTRLGGEGGRSGGWTMGEMEKRRPKVLGRTQRRSFPGFPPVLNYRAGRLRASAQRHHTNQKTWGVSSSHQNDRGKVESGPFESEEGDQVEISGTLESRGDSGANICLDVDRKNVDVQLAERRVLRQDIRTMKKKWILDSWFADNVK